MSAAPRFRPLLVACLAVACGSGGVDPSPADGGDGGDVDDADLEPAADAVEGDGGSGPVDAPAPDVADAEVDEGPPPVVCPAFQRFCASQEEVGQCAGDGTSFESVETCDAGENCRAATATCEPVVCSPGEPLCSGGSGYHPCDASGTGPDESVVVPCEGGTTCFPWSGCVDAGCQAGTWACMAGGQAGKCTEEGWSPEPTPCYGGTCVTCVTDTSFVVCKAATEEGEALPADLQACPPDTACVDGAGCLPEPCSPGSTACLPGSVLASCIGGAAGWSASACPESHLCVETGPTQAQCVFDCASSVDCLLDTCDPLPPLGGGGGGPDWVPPTDSNLLLVSFGVGLTPDFKHAYVNLAPIVNPKDGTFVDGLDAYTVDPATGEEQGEILIREDGVTMNAICLALSTTQYATVDVVFVLDVTGSMSGTITKVKNSAVALAGYWTAVGLDVRFGVVPYDDEAPAIGTKAFPLSDDLDAFTTFVGKLQAAGGGDGPENPLDAFVLAWDTFEWRSGAQRVFLLMTDASMHVPGDGTSFAKNGLDDVLGAIAGKAVVHTVGPDSLSAWEFGGTANPHLLSCATGGTSESLQDFLVEDVQDSLFAVAVTHSHHCLFKTDSPTALHDVQVEVRVEHEGQLLVGATTKPQVDYLSP